MSISRPGADRPAEPVPGARRQPVRTDHLDLSCKAPPPRHPSEWEGWADAFVYELGPEPEPGPDALAVDIDRDTWELGAVPLLPLFHPERSNR